MRRNIPTGTRHHSHRGEDAPGEHLTLYTKADPSAPSNDGDRLRATKNDLAFRDCAGSVQGARRFLLEPLGDRVRFTLREEYGGLLLPMIGKSIPDLNPIFVAFCAALKKRAKRPNQPRQAGGRSCEIPPHLPILSA